MRRAKARMGRPALPEGAARSNLLGVRLTLDERAELDAAAFAADFSSVSDWARDVLLAAASSRCR